VAIYGSDLPEGKTIYDENNWSDLNHPTATAYSRSKTMAERAAWQWRTGNAPDMKLTTINPGLVLGPPLDRHYGSSAGLMERLLKGKDPMLPDVRIPCVDVRDVARMHIRAIDRPKTCGKRIIASDRTLSLPELGRLLKNAYPDRKIPIRTAPNLMIRILSLFDSTLKPVVPILGVQIEASNALARSLLDMKFIDARDSAVETAAYLVDNQLV